MLSISNIIGESPNISSRWVQAISFINKLVKTLTIVINDDDQNNNNNSRQATVIIINNNLNSTYLTSVGQSVIVLPYHLWSSLLAAVGLLRWRIPSGPDSSLLLQFPGPDWLSLLLNPHLKLISELHYTSSPASRRLAVFLAAPQLPKSLHSQIRYILTISWLGCTSQLFYSILFLTGHSWSFTQALPLETAVLMLSDCCVLQYTLYSWATISWPVWLTAKLVHACLVQSLLYLRLLSI